VSWVRCSGRLRQEAWGIRRAVLGLVGAPGPWAAYAWEGKKSSKKLLAVIQGNWLSRKGLPCGWHQLAGAIWARCDRHLWGATNRQAGGAQVVCKKLFRLLAQAKLRPPRFFTTGLSGGPPFTQEKKKTGCGNQRL